MIISSEICRWIQFLIHEIDFPMWIIMLCSHARGGNILPGPGFVGSWFDAKGFSPSGAGQISTYIRDEGDQRKKLSGEEIFEGLVLFQNLCPKFTIMSRELFSSCSNFQKEGFLVIMDHSLLTVAQLKTALKKRGLQVWLASVQVFLHTLSESLQMTVGFYILISMWI